MLSEDKIATRLKEAIETGEVLRIVYHGGSQPGTFRDVTPIAVGEEQVRARCHASQAVKLFMLSDIEIRDMATTNAETCKVWSPDFPPKSPFKTVAEVHDFNRLKFEAMGWRIEFSQGEFIDELNLFDPTPKGKKGYVSKYPEVWFMDEHTRRVIEEPIYNVEEDVFEAIAPKPRVNRWSYGKGGGGPYKEMDRALAGFLAFAEERRPGQSHSREARHAMV